ncbi:oxidoreductase [Polynucleobacter wuianus]|uniref:PDR/VanB family oxidoreductase n=1 Tax=Polynucleobacter wuianus TaxID=1743168 RepID=UPI001C0C8C00|nr:PDR/VanB family oxidoreductase [Polynucleobacter wuianus]MBU3611163.1 oxidoreductase [Polynucleobacter wuianus]
MSQEIRRVQVLSIDEIAKQTLKYTLIPADGRALPAFEPGAHIDVYLPNGMVRQYSLCGKTTDRFYTIAVKYEEVGRGGSVNLHTTVRVDDFLAISTPRNNFPLINSKKKVVFIAGGIGITPIFSMIQSLIMENRDWELHYCARSQEHAAFYDQLTEIGGNKIKTYFSEEPILDIASLFEKFEDDLNIYCCGPSGLMKSVEGIASNYPQQKLHFEWFAAPISTNSPNIAFEIQLNKSNTVLLVPENKSILTVLRENSYFPISNCEQGLCGSCETTLLDGQADHRDSLLSEEEKKANKTIMICVSRAKSDRLVLDI